MDHAHVVAAACEAFRRRALEGGADEVVERRWAPLQVVDTHSHPFDADGLVTAGEMWLTHADGRVQHLRPGDGFSLPAGTPHAERYGAEGATYWVARRSVR